MRFTLNFKQLSSSSFKINGFNNAHLGYKQYGGATFTKARDSAKLQGTLLSWKVSYLVPSGYGDGNRETHHSEIVLNSKDLTSIDKKGFRVFCKSKLSIPDEMEKEIPSNIPLMAS